MITNNFMITIFIPCPGHPEDLVTSCRLVARKWNPGFYNLSPVLVITKNCLGCFPALWNEGKAQKIRESLQIIYCIFLQVIFDGAWLKWWWLQRFGDYFMVDEFDCRGVWLSAICDCLEANSCHWIRYADFLVEYEKKNTEEN